MACIFQTRFCAAATRPIRHFNGDQTGNARFCEIADGDRADMICQRVLSSSAIRIITSSIEVH